MKQLTAILVIILLAPCLTFGQTNTKKKTTKPPVVKPVSVDTSQGHRYVYTLTFTALQVNELFASRQAALYGMANSDLQSNVTTKATNALNYLFGQLQKQTLEENKRIEDSIKKTKPDTIKKAINKQ